MTELHPVEFFRHGLGPAELASVQETLGSLFLTLGPRVGRFEERFAQLLGAPHVIGTSSCSMSLILTLRALGVGPGDEVVTTPMTFVATSNAVLHVGATPVFADIDAATGLIDVEDAARRIGPRTKALIVVHLYGQLCDMRALRALCDRHGLALIEDAAHAVEAERDGVRVAELGDATTFSFYATKSLTSGDGGAIAVRDAQLAARLRGLRNHGVSKDAAARHGGSYAHWDLLELGYKAAMTDVEAALLLPQLDRVWERQARRAALAQRYLELLADVPEVRCIPWEGRSAHHLFPVLVPPGQRDRVLAELGSRKIGCAVNYRSVHTLHYYREELKLRREALPIAADFGDRVLSLPLWPDLPPEDLPVVVEALRAALRDAER